ncbi:MAG TPA: 4a-hydroxytetrahydrobiopterin dehydratase [Thermoanaerobaculia bacterium]|nr:4a-hydroxytetrahydrobiopterin dehydratase [Thermoanaerobaculia bacterium]
MKTESTAAPKPQIGFPPPPPGQPAADLKAERVQLQLEDLPGWSLRRGGRAIVRSFDLPEMESALAFLDYLSDLGAVRERLPEIDLRPGKATVSIKTPSAGWLERPDFELALAMKFRG